MLPLFELLTQAQNGQAAEMMAKQFGLAQEQLMNAFSALTPAFSSGFKRSASNPYDFTRLMQSFASGNYSQYFEDMRKAFSPEGINDGNNILAQIFGSKEVSRAIAEQAAQMSGINQDVLKRMMPVMATAMMGGLFRQMAGQFQAAGDALSDGDMQRFFQTWLSAAGLAEKPRKEEVNLFDNPFLKMFQDMVSSPKAGAAQSPNDPFAGNPFMEMFSRMTTPPAGKPQDAKTAEAPADSANSFATTLNQMFESGLEVQKNYQKSMDNIINSYFSAAKK